MRRFQKIERGRSEVNCIKHLILVYLGLETGVAGASPVLPIPYLGAINKAEITTIITIQPTA
jgi:hypothetical protein